MMFSGPEDDAYKDRREKVESERASDKARMIHGGVRGQHHLGYGNRHDRRRKAKLERVG